ncbi:NADPH dehydrogenase [Plectosphaerella plurivora]|uniref:NADPH dehydrogenase n=1 Tax=Plectosphaerella plurivora TaxID=936078 RepID=A0A9P9A961_9PEZI|nr:NADPH dehydrogenase [Plectosphaerella plurivora]
MSASTSKLFEPIKLGRIQLKHRVALAPLTRIRNDENHVALPMKQKYYADRGSVPGTLVIAEATGIATGQEGAQGLPSFVTDAQVASWKKVISAVHDNGSFWFQQLWDQGRAADPEYTASRGGKYKSSSAVQLDGKDVAPEEATEEDIQQVIKDYTETAKRVIAAGGDGVEIHGAHGYLLDQFLSDKVNQRTDKWGGSIENRARLVLEVVRSVSAAIGADRVGLRLSPYASFQGAEKSDFKELNLYILEQLKTTLDTPLAYLSLVEAVGDPAKFFESEDNRTLDFLLEAWNNFSPVIVAGGYTPESAQKAVDDHYAKWDVIIAFGRLFLANPDLVFRIQHGIELNQYNRSTFYLPASEEGYNDYPFSPEYLKASA